MKGILLFAWTALITELVYAQCPTADWLVVNGGNFPRCMLCRNSVDTSVRTGWRSALDDCNAKGGTLTGVHSAEQLAFVSTCLASTGGSGEPVWVGLVRPDGGDPTDLDEAWLDGRAVTYGKNLINDGTTAAHNCFVYARTTLFFEQACTRPSGYVCSRDPITCLLPDSPHYGTLSSLSPAIADVPNGFAYSGQSVTYLCSAGYEPSSTAIRTCQLDGTWSPAASLCEPVNCGPPQVPQFGGVSAPVTTLNSQACYSCNDGYVMDGSATATCQGSGSWSPSDAPVCTAATTTTTTTNTTAAADEASTFSVAMVAGAAVGSAVLGSLVTGLVCAMMRPSFPAAPGPFPPPPRFPPVMPGRRPGLPGF